MDCANSVTSVFLFWGSFPPCGRDFGLFFRTSLYAEPRATDSVTVGPSFRPFLIMNRTHSFANWNRMLPSPVFRTYRTSGYDSGAKSFFLSSSQQFSSLRKIRSSGSSGIAASAFPFLYLPRLSKIATTSQNFSLCISLVEVLTFLGCSPNRHTFLSARRFWNALQIYGKSE